MADETNNQITNESAGSVNAGAEVNTESTTPSFDDVLKTGNYQAEFDRRVNKAIETARGKFTDPKVNELQEQLNGYQRRESAANAGVSEAFREFVVWETVKTMSGETTFDDALKAYLEKHPQYTAEPSAQQPAAGWGKPQTGNSEPQMSGVETAFRRNNPKLKID